MPSIAEKRKVLDGKGEVCRFKHRDGFFYREHIKGTTRYNTKKIEGANSIDEAERLAFEAYAVLRKTEASIPASILVSSTKKRVGVKDVGKSNGTKEKTIKLTSAIDSYCQWSKELYEQGKLPRNSYSGRMKVMNLHLVSYFHWKGISYSRQIDQDTFLDYELFRKSAKSIFTIKGEQTVINHFLKKWLRNKGYLNQIDFDELWTSRKIKESDLTANPAINADDWSIITKTIRKWKVDGADKDKRCWYWRNLFWNWCLICKNSGARPEELLKLKWSEVDVVDEGRYSQSTLDTWVEWLNTNHQSNTKATEEEWDRVLELKQEYPQTRTNSLLEEHLTEEHRQELARAEKLVAYITLWSAKTGHFREVPTSAGREFVRWGKFQKEYLKNHYPDITITGKDYVFGLPSKEMRPHSYGMYQKYWARLRGIGDVFKPWKDPWGRKVVGNKFARGKEYTPYSLRTTYIENQLMNDTPIADVAKAAGNSPDVIAKHYSKMDLRKKQEQLTQIPYGKKGKTPLPKRIKPYE